MRKILMILLTGILAAAMAVPALAEQTTLTYSYGEDAFNKHMLSVENTVEYAGETYTFTTGGFDFESVFMLTGGNTCTVYELEVPRIRQPFLPENEAALLGTVTITPSADMTYHVFSGDRVSGQYTLVDSGEAASYTLEICAERDESGTLRLIDKVFLFSCQEDGEEKHYAASLYISYEGINAAPAAGTPASAAAATADEQPQISPADLEADMATYISMVRILEEERTRLCAQLADKDAQRTELTAQLTQKDTEITRLNGEVATLTQQVADKDALTAQLTQKDAEITRLNGEVASLTQQVADKDALTAQLTQKDAEITRLNGEVATLTQQVADKDALTAQLTQKDTEITRLNGEVATLTQQNTQLTADKNAVAAQLTAAQTNAADAAALQAQIATLETEKAALQQEAQQAAALAERVAQLEQELTTLRSMPAPTAIPTEVPTATPEPTAAPTAAPTATPELTAAPTAAPTATPEPTAAPTAAPTATPEPTAAPTAAPTATPEPTAAPTAVPVQTADTAITFRERAWGTSADEIAQWLLQEGIVTNQYSLLSGGHAWLQPCYYSFVFLNAEGRVPEQNPYQSSTKMIWASEFLSPDFRVFGYEVENLYFSFRCEGDATRLIGAAVDLRCPEGEEAAFADVQAQLRGLYGQGNADDSTVYLRLGQNNTAVHLARRPYDGLILTWGDTTAVQAAE